MKAREDGGSRAVWGKARTGIVSKRGTHVRIAVGMMLLVVVGATTLVHLRSVPRASNLGLYDEEEIAVIRLPGRLQGELFKCDRSQFRTDVCSMKGDIHAQQTSLVLYTSDPNTRLGEEKVRPYTRKWEKGCMETVHEVTLHSVLPSHIPSARCDVNHSVPGVVFSTGGYTGNVYHEFNDGLIPLFITTQHLKGEVVFVVVEFHDWWLMKYMEIVGQLSNYDVVDLEGDARVHCFPELTVGLHIHAELAVDPARMPGQETIQNFRTLLEHAYSSDPGIEEEGKEVWKEERGTMEKEGGQVEEGKVSIPQPRLSILVRSGTRMLLNLDQIVRVAQGLGYNVTLLRLDPTTELRRVFATLNSTDVLMGVHGAALTHFLFMRPGSVFIQIVPLGTHWAASTYYGEPAVKLGLQYLEYKIQPEESSLSEKYKADDPVLTDPTSILDKGWWAMKEIYLEAQDVRLAPKRIRALLNKAKKRLRTNPC